MRKLIVLFVLVCGEAAAQMAMSSHVMEMRDEIAPEDLPVPRKLNGIGNSHMQISANPEAQIWFDQGLNLIHDFWDYESARAFEQSIRTDPQCAICYWGLYKAESFYHSTSQDHAGRVLKQAVALKEHTAEREKMYIEATALQGDRDFRGAVEIWRKVVEKYPTDAQAKLALASAVGGAEALSIYRSILETNPQDSAANHYLIHALEGSPHPEEALRSAEILGALAPASGHMVHMPGHIFFRVGDYSRAEQSFAAALEADERYMREQHISADNNWNYVHNVMYAVANLMEEGKFRRASELSAKLAGARGELETTLYVYSARDSISRLSPDLPVALRNGDWTAVLELAGSAKPRAEWSNLKFLGTQLKLLATGMQAINRRDFSTAKKALTEMQAGLKDQPKGSLAGRPRQTGEHPKNPVLPDALLPPIVSTLSIMLGELEGSLLAAQGELDRAKKVFASAHEQELNLGYHEPPLYIRPVAETEGAAMLEAGQYEAAKVAFQEALDQRPKSGFGLYGLALAAENSGDRAASASQFRKFLEAWNDADPELPQLKHARAAAVGQR